ncbi:hypothetical protein [Aureimonas frigidaquae]|uniref:Uncharacterized protein n=1 Tax=Aureimonas frigidaquae TaxID=424757 RepID=A0A0P0Z150_9HYPH|nr:hypothetical protein [Aureimonas frigidaquae]BAT27707.1 hypothetical protein [Aureimonas frigidaquae]
MKNPIERLHSFGQKPEESRIPEKGELPRVNDTTAGMAGQPDPVLHQPAAASADADAEAGADAGDEASGRTEPLAPTPPPRR